MTSKQLGIILNKLGKVKPISTGGYSAHCPAHQDAHNSLGITEEGGKILVTCRTGCTTEQIVKALGLELKDLFTDKPETTKETRWPIKDKDGNTIAEHVRYDKPDGKSFAWYRDGKKGLGDIKTADLPLYGIDKLKDRDMVIICEGEKAADSLIKRGFNGLGTVSGASSAPSEQILSEIIDAECIYLWPDNDEPGHNHMDKIANRLIKLGAKPMVVVWPEAPNRGDAADFSGDINNLVSHAELWREGLLVVKDKGPEIEVGFNSINYRWPQYNIRILVDRFNDEGQAELSFYSKNGCDTDKILHFTRANMLATTTMNTLAKRMSQNNDEVPWNDLLTFITMKTIEIAREGEPATEIWPNPDDSLEAQYLLEPLLYLNHPTVIFGSKGSLKSFISLMIAYVLQLPLEDNKLGLVTPEYSTKVLFLDYEDDKNTFGKRWSAITNGFNHPPMPLLHKRMTTPLYDNIDPVKRIVDKEKIGLIIVDSLAPASRGDLNSTEPAIKYHAALRQIGVTSLTLAHKAKDDRNKSTIFGSVFFTNLTRSVWECRNEQDPGDSEAIISLKHNDANLSRKHNSIGIRASFESNAIKMTRCDLIETALSDQLPLSIRIKALLNRGSMSIKEITDTIEGATQESVRVTLYKMQKKGIALKIGSNWGLATEQE